MKSKKSFFGAALGTMVEYYDYALLNLLLPIVSPLFFPAQSAYQSLVKSYFILLIAAIARPIGGLCFGYFGDKVGRKKALLGSMYGIALSTFVIGFTPTYQAIGVWSIVIILLGKTTQVFCFGGEYNGAGVYVVEHAEKQHEGFWGSCLTATTLIGSLIASLMGIFITLKFMPVWGWRIAFIIGGLIGLLGIFYRKEMLESPSFKTTNISNYSLKQVISTYKTELFAGIFIGGFATTAFTTVLTFINPVLVTSGYLSNHHFMLLQTLIIIVAIITLVLSGMLSDRFSPRKVMTFGAILLIILPYPLLLGLDHHLFIWILFGEIALITINEIVLGPSNAYLKNLFPMQVRWRAVSLSFGIGYSLFGGLTPLIESYLFHESHQFSTISLWLGFVGFGTLLSLYLVKLKQQMVNNPLAFINQDSLSNT